MDMKDNRNLIISILLNLLADVYKRQTEHARQLLLGLGRSNTWRYAFAQVYTCLLYTSNGN